MQHIGKFLRNVPTRTLDGRGGATRAGEPIPKWEKDKWEGPGRKEVDRELARRAKRRKKSEAKADILGDAPRVIPSGRRRGDSTK